MFNSARNVGGLVPVGLVCVVIGLATCPPWAFAETPQDAPATVERSRTLANSINDFGLDLWGRLRANGREGNAAISPISIGLALSMTYAGARGTTAAEFRHVLHIHAGPEATARQARKLMNTSMRAVHGTVAIANRLYADVSHRLRPPYVALTRRAFGAAVERVNFRRDSVGAVDAINRWVSSTTHGRIPTIVDTKALTDVTRLVLVNAIYFKARWEHPFDKHRTQYESFFVDGTRQVVVPMMHSDGGRYGRIDGARVLEMDYQGRDLAMLFVLPETRDGLPELEARLDGALFAAWVNAATTSASAIALPSFRVETEAIELAGPLNALGLKLAFTDSADFGGMSASSKDRLHVGHVLHRAFVEVNEEGTEAAAATAVGMDNLIGGVLVDDSRRFIANHPFLFFIRDRRTNTILFAGRITDPR